jgi:hypothetical protein
MKITVEDLFKKAEVDWTSMDINSSIDISNKNIQIKSFNERTQEIEFRKIKRLWRKEDSEIYRVFKNSKVTLFKASPFHKVYALVNDKWEYKSLCDLESNYIGLNDKGEQIELYIEKLPIKDSILDFEIEENHNYFANGILSHNTSPGGKALKFQASIRLEIRKKEFIVEKNETIGLRSKLKGVKNKTAPPMKKQEIEFYFGEGINSDLEWVDFAIMYDVIKKGGAWFNVPGVEDKFQGKLKVIEYLKTHEDEYNNIIEETKKRMYPSIKRERVIEEPTFAPGEIPLDEDIEFQE